MSDESKKTAFELTLKEVNELMESVNGWTDINNPIVPQAKGGTFRDALKKGAAQLKNTSFIDSFKQ